MFGIKNKKFRFRKPDFQAKLARARTYQRKSSPRPTGSFGRLLFALGLRSKFSKFLILAFLVAAAYYLTISDRFIVTEAILDSTTELTQDQIKATLAKMRHSRTGMIIPSNHILVLDPTKLLSALQHDIPEIRSIKKFKKIFPNKLELSLEKREAIYVWQSGSDFFLLDQDGVIFSKLENFAPDESQKILINDTTARAVAIGEKLPIEKDLNFTVSINELWPKMVTQTTLKSFMLPSLQSSDILAKTDIGFAVYFDTMRSPETQMKNLSSLLNSEIKPETYSGLSYIDLRLSHIAYYCYKDAPCAIEYATSTKP